jgi:hypothetical protein
MKLFENNAKVGDDISQRQILFLVKSALFCSSLKCKGSYSAQYLKIR